MKQSAGILLYKIVDGELQVLLVHPGGPLFAKRDAGFWSVPKGEYTDDEDALAAAVRELREETGAEIDAALDAEPGAESDAESDAPAHGSRLVPLGSVRQKTGKVVTAWAVEADFDVTTLVSNLFELEWPPRSGLLREFPEVDRGEWFTAEAAREKINSAQAAFIDRLATWLAGETSD